MPENVDTRKVEISVLRSALGNWLWNNRIINNGEDDPIGENPDALGLAGEIPNARHFLNFLYNNYPTIE